MHASLEEHQARAYPSFLNVKQPGVFYFLLDGMLVHCSVTHPLASGLCTSKLTRMNLFLRENARQDGATIRNYNKLNPQTCMMRGPGNFRTWAAQLGVWKWSRYCVITLTSHNLYNLILSQYLMARKSLYCMGKLKSNFCACTLYHSVG